MPTPGDPHTPPSGGGGASHTTGHFINLIYSISQDRFKRILIIFVLNLLVVAHTVFVIGTQLSRTDLNVLNSIKKAYYMKIHFKILCLQI